MLDLSAVERQALARYTQDAGNHVSLECVPPRDALASAEDPLRRRRLRRARPAGRRGAAAPAARGARSVDFCVVNGENAADGAGSRRSSPSGSSPPGADAITLGNHAWAREELAPYLAGAERVVRPANLSRHAPGRGLAVVPPRGRDAGRRAST